MADPRLIADGIRDPASTAVNELLDRLAALPIEKVLVYFVDQVDASALVHLADQFHVLGAEGWSLCETDEERRALIRNAIALHRHKGTPWSIREAIRAVGYLDAVITEGGAFAMMDGAYLMDGGVSMALGGGWAEFDVQVDVGGQKGLTPWHVSQLHELIGAWKNARSHLRGLAWAVTLEDEITLDESVAVIAAPVFAEEVPGGLRMNGQINMDQASVRQMDGSFLMNGVIPADALVVHGHRMDNHVETFVLGGQVYFEDRNRARVTFPLVMNGEINMDQGAQPQGQYLMDGSLTFGGLKPGGAVMDGQQAREDTMVEGGLALTITRHDPGGDVVGTEVLR